MEVGTIAAILGGFAPSAASWFSDGGIGLGFALPLGFPV
jgi:hypothetical protein